jgi:hypothetical protein
MVTRYIDIKSHDLRDILRVVLHGIKAISLMEDKPSVTETEHYSNLKDNADIGLDQAEYPFSFPLKSSTSVRRI